MKKMFQTLLALGIFLLGLQQLFANKKEGHTHKHSHKKHSHHGHSHGKAEASIAFEGSLGKLFFKVPGEAIFGFEHKAVKEKDIQKQKEGLEKLARILPEIFAFDANLNCQWTQNKMDVSTEGSHSDVIAEFQVSCSQPLAGSVLKVQNKPTLPRLKHIDLSLIIDDFQTSKVIKTSQQTIEIPKK